jgi:hypothetical protein
MDEKDVSRTMTYRNLKASHILGAAPHTSGAGSSGIILQTEEIDCW